MFMVQVLKTNFKLCTIIGRYLQVIRLPADQLLTKFGSAILIYLTLQEEKMCDPYIYIYDPYGQVNSLTIDLIKNKV